MPTLSTGSRTVRLLLAGTALAAVQGCGGDAGGAGAITGNVVGDRTAPTVVLSAAPAGSASDSTVAFLVSARDNLGLKRVTVTATQRLPVGRDTSYAALDTVFTSAVTTFDRTVVVRVPLGTPAGTQIALAGAATDGAGNAAPSASFRVAAGNLEPPKVALTAPTPGTLFVIGKSGTIAIAASARLKVRTVGWIASGAFRDSNSVAFPQPLKDTVSVIDTLRVPTSATAGVVSVTPFVIDSLGQRANGVPVAFAVQPITAVNSVPVVRAGLTRRIEVRDTIRVTATDPTGIRTIGYEILRASTGALIDSASRSFSGDLTVAEFTFPLRLERVLRDTTSVYVRAFAVNMAQRRAYAALPSGQERRDTALVTLGMTIPLRDGGLIADGLFVPRYDRLYLTNIDRNQLEVFSLADTTFKRPIVVGSRPWGLTPWPRNRAGDMGDTILVANSGGTNVSYVQLDPGSGAGLEVYRYPLPNIIAYSVTSQLSQNTGQVIQQRTVYDFSDRPQFVAATCDTAVAANAECGEVRLVYSTTPTAGQTMPFPRKGTIRWENLTRCTSHFFFEHAVGQSEKRADTLEVVRFAPLRSYPLPATCDTPQDSTVLVPYFQWVTNEAGQRMPYSVVVEVEKLGFRDTTFVRNSGNFARTIAGEGGQVLGSRAVGYDANRGLMQSFPLGGNTWTFTIPVFDLGVSRAKDVSDWIANTFSAVRGVAINFDGALSAIRGDSTYIIDPQLRLQGLMQTSGGANAGFDFHPRNTGSGANNPDVTTRLAFSASAEPRIEVFDSYCYQKLGTIETRDPIVGPIKAARRSNGDVVLVAATARGVVLVKLNQTFGSGCTPR